MGHNLEDIEDIIHDDLVCHRVNDVVHADANCEACEFLGVVGVVGVFPRVALTRFGRF